MENQKKNAFFIVEFNTLKQILFDRREDDLNWNIIDFFDRHREKINLDKIDIEFLGFYYDPTNERLIIKVKTDYGYAGGVPLCLGMVKFQDDIVCGSCPNWERGFCKEKRMETNEYNICREIKTYREEIS